MDKEILNIVSRDFSKSDINEVIKELSTITLDYVMVESENNLRNTYISILKLSNGSLEQLTKYVKSAKQDFRDVIYWASKI
jgi:hypothetical protein